ncbi:sodium-dependent phosphate transport protein 2C-like [Macrobrachium nipponense]|uniref:sodium-dependent phosphate transport protein 2C-like n=1 Tax=Macrobrachium nipponense TaxID=159736 RepID=UPI0030C8703F
MVKKPSKLVKKKSFKQHGLPSEELVTVKSDLILLAPEVEQIEAKKLQGGKGRRRKVTGDLKDPITGEGRSDERGLCGGTHGRRLLKALTIIGKILLLVGLLYLFICSLNLLASSFRLLGGKTASAVFRQSALLSNPVVGLMIGVLVTVLVQSSSTSSSIIVSMVAAHFLDVKTAIPIIMGANIGTSVTNSLVSIGQVGDREQFERAFSGAVVHDMFNWLSVLVLLPLEVATGYLYHLTKAVLDGVTFEKNNMKVELLSRITKPFTDAIVKLDKTVLTGWTMNDPDYENATLLHRYCPDPSNTTEYITCPNLAAHIPLSDTGMGLVLLTASLVLLLVCLISIVKILSSMLKGSVAGVVQHVINADLPRVPWLTGYIAILAGAIMTFILQSSSIFTSTLTPLVGLGVISIERVYPLTLGSNLGTTTTALLAALASDSSRLHPAIQIALIHLFFNVTGLLLWYPIPFLRLPVRLALALGRVTAKYRWVAVFYMLSTFFLAPVLVFLVSLGGPVAMYSVFIPIVVFILLIVFVNVAQSKFPRYLPTRLQTWHWLPLCLRSLEPMDECITRLMCCRQCRTHKYAHVPPVATIHAPPCMVVENDLPKTVVVIEAEKTGGVLPEYGLCKDLGTIEECIGVSREMKDHGMSYPGIFIQHETSA